MILLLHDSPCEVLKYSSVEITFASLQRGPTYEPVGPKRRGSKYWIIFCEKVSQTQKGSRLSHDTGFIWS